METDCKVRTQWIGLLGWYSICITDPNAVSLISSSKGKPAHEHLTETRSHLLFNTFYIERRLEETTNTDADQRFLRLMCSASFYLCGFDQKARNVMDQISKKPNSKLEQLLHWLILSDKIPSYQEEMDDYFEPLIQPILSNISSPDSLILAVDSLQKNLHQSGSPRWMIVGDVISAVIRLMILRNQLPRI